jgi:hypothetical protein
MGDASVAGLLTEADTSTWTTQSLFGPEDEE